MRLAISYYGSYLSEHLKNDLKEIKNSYCDDVVITISENDFNYFTGKWQLAPKIAHDCGLKIYADFWGFACAFGGGRISKLLIDHPEVSQVDSNGKKLGMGCINNPLLKKTYENFIEKLAPYGYDGYLIDEPTKNQCYCSWCRKQYEEEYNQPIPLEETSNLKQFRKKSVIKFVEEMCNKIKKVNSELATWTVIMPTPTDKDMWEDVAKIDNLDILGTDPYWLIVRRDISWLFEITKQFLPICKHYNKISDIWINCWRIPQGKEKEIYEGTKKCAELGPDRISAWSYKGGMGTYEESDNPLKAWENLVDAYKEIKGEN